MSDEKILISACLVGQPVRYNGLAKLSEHPQINQWHKEGRLIVVCPEVGAGLTTPRAPAEIASGKNGEAVLNNSAQVLDKTGINVTEAFVQGAFHALNLAQKHGCRFALLTDSSPSCGSSQIYDGSFTGNKHAGSGVTAALLRRHNIRVFSELQIDELYRLTG